MRRLALIVASYYEQGKSKKWPGRPSVRLVRLSRVFLKVHYIRVCVTLLGPPLTSRFASLFRRSYI